MAPKGHQPQHKTDYHVTPNPTPKRTTTKFKKNTATAKGTGMPTKGGTGMKGKHC